MGVKRNKLWTIVAIALAILTIRTVFSQSEGISPAKLLALLRNADPMLVFLASLGMLGIIFFEGEAVRLILGAVGYPRSHGRGFLYGAADVYFSAITPSASGGQPASAFFMVRDGAPLVIVTAVLLLNLVMYTLAIVSIGLVIVIARPELFFRFQLLSQILIVAGFVCLSGLAVLFYFLLKRQEFFFGLASKLLHFLSAHHLVRHPEKLAEKLDRAKHEYAACVGIMSGHLPMLIGAYVLNLLQRLSQFASIIFIYLATGGSVGKVWDLFATQLYIILGSNCVPVPGGMGVTDFLMIDGYGQLFDRAYAFELEMLGRSFSFYLCIIISATAVLIGYLTLKRGKKGTA